MTKRIKLEELKTIMGKPFRDAVVDDSGNAVMELRKDSDGKPIVQIPRDAKGMAIPDTVPEPVYQIKTKPIEKNALLELLKSLYLRIPREKLTRLDTIQGTRMFESIAQAKDGYLELSDDVYRWVNEKLQDKETEDKEGNVIPGIGLGIFGVNLTIIEDALDNRERLHEPKEKVKKAQQGEESDS